MLKNLTRSTQKLIQKPFALCFVLLVLGILAYGLYIPWMGFYWDDWPWVWFSHVMEPVGMLQIDIEHRPISGLILYLGTILSGANPLGWQIYNLVFRLMGSISLAWMLRVLWPRHKEQTTWVALLFLVYPGFGQQFVSVNNSRHLFPLITFFLSIGLMIKANKEKESHYWKLTIAALISSIITMLTTEYYYGLELIRPIVLWVLLREQSSQSICCARLGEIDAGSRNRPASVDDPIHAGGFRKPASNLFDWSERLQNPFSKTILPIFGAWLPYLLPLVGVFFWRYTISKGVNYQITVFDKLSAAPPRGVLQFLRAWGGDIVSAGLGVWPKILRQPDPMLFGPRSRLYYWGLTIVATVGVLLFFIFSRSSPAS
ncbi:MAG: hypothetical protein U9Q82_00495, partial [Chloroflexota bacterium]|nr:hypothetical protein [Chloroflexota bacterium]